MSYLLTGSHPIGQKHSFGAAIGYENAIDQTFATGPVSTLILQGETGGTRNGAIYNMGGVDVYLFRGPIGMNMKAPQALNKGIRIPAGGMRGMFAGEDRFLGDIYAVSASPSLIRISIQQS